MSGGSYNYLYCHVRGLEEQRGDLESMARRLEGLPYAAAAAFETRRCLRMLDELERVAQSLSDAWHAVEWWDSCDYAEDQVRAVVEPWRPPVHVEYAGPDPTRTYRLVDVGGGVFELRPVEGPTS